MRRHVSLARQQRAQTFELCLEVRDLAAELGQRARGRETTLDVRANRIELRLPLREALLRGPHVVVPEDTGAGERQHEERAELTVPGQLVEAEVHCHFCVSGGDEAALAPPLSRWRGSASAPRCGCG